MALKKKAEEHENHERWLVSYADFITLLFAFFVVMYSTSDRDAKKLKQLEVSLVKSFGSHESGPMEKQNGSPWTESESNRYAPIANNYVVEKKEEVAPEKIFDEDDPLRILQREMERLLQAEGGSRGFNLTLSPRGLTISVNEKAVFVDDSTKVQSSFKPALDGIAKKLKSLPNELVIEGVAIPIPGRSLEAGLELLNSQGLEIRRVLVDARIEKERITETSIVGRTQIGLKRSEELADGATLDIVVLRQSQ